MQLETITTTDGSRDAAAFVSNL